MDNFNLTDEELEELKRVYSTDEWNDVVKSIKIKRGGECPPDWYQKVIANPEIDTTFTIKSFDNLDDFFAELNLKRRT